MSAIENLLKTVLKVSGINIEEVKGEVTGRIAAFENNVKTLNETLISLAHRQGDLETNLARMMEAQGMTYIKTAKPETEENADTRKPVPAIEGHSTAA